MIDTIRIDIPLPKHVYERIKNERFATVEYTLLVYLTTEHNPHYQQAIEWLTKNIATVELEEDELEVLVKSSSGIKEYIRNYYAIIRLKDD